MDRKNTEENVDTIYPPQRGFELEQNIPTVSFNYNYSLHTDLTGSKNGPCSKIYR